MSLFDRDKNIEEIVSKWTEQYLFNNKKYFSGEYIRNTDIQLQKSGVDIILKSHEIFKDNKYHNIDEKSATSYIKTSLKESNIPTFAFELDYKNKDNNSRNDGWLFGEQFDKTEYYLISWIWADITMKNGGKFGKKREVTFHKILKEKLFLISKKDMHSYLRNIKVTKRNFNIISEKIRSSGEIKIIIPRGNPNRTPNIQYSKHLEEKPVNVVISEYKLKQLSIKTWEIESVINN